MITSISVPIAVFSALAAALSIPEHFQNVPTTQDQKQTYTVHLTRIPSTNKTASHSLWKSIRPSNSLTTGAEPLSSADLGQDFLGNVTFGTNTRTAIIDTGSSDTWLVETGFTCVDYTTNFTIAESQCHFGAPVAPSSTFVSIPNTNFNISYADGEYLNGHVGTDTVTFGGITVPKQEVSLAYLAGWFGDTFSSGLVGLAFPSITSVYSGSDPRQDVASTRGSNQIPYSPLMNTIFFVQNLTAPIFSISLSRDGGKSTYGYGGSIEIGGTPDLQQSTINASSTFVTAPIQLFGQQAISSSKTAYTFYAVDVDGLSYRTARSQRSIQYIVDSGTTLFYVPSADAAAINALFVPPAQLVQGNYLIECNAKPPQIGVKIGGTVLPLNPQDLIYKTSTSSSVCQSGIQDGGTGPYILGDVFMVNVISVFDVGNMQMRFASRPYYT